MKSIPSLLPTMIGWQLKKRHADPCMKQMPPTKNVNATHVGLCVLAIVFVGTGVQAQSDVAKGPFDNPSPSAPLPPEEQFKGRMVIVEAMLPTFGEEGGLDAARLEQRRQFILNTPDIAPYLVAIADARIEQKSARVSEVFDAMAMRPDVDPAAIARYVDRADAMMRTLTTRESMSAADYNYFEGVAKILEKRPSQDSERILIRMLEVGAVEPAAKALAQMGTVRSLPVLEAVVEKYKLMDKEKGDASMRPWLDHLIGSLEMLRRRVADAQNTPNATGGQARGGGGSFSTAWIAAIVLGACFSVLALIKRLTKTKS
ncbi:MAG: hypothetical protein ACO1TE_14550 [Prosthecobacter sp.]